MIKDYNCDTIQKQNAIAVDNFAEDILIIGRHLINLMPVSYSRMFIEKACNRIIVTESELKSLNLATKTKIKQYEDDNKFDPYYGPGSFPILSPVIRSSNPTYIAMLEKTYIENNIIDNFTRDFNLFISKNLSNHYTSGHNLANFFPSPLFYDSYSGIFRKVYGAQQYMNMQLDHTPFMPVESFNMPSIINIKYRNGNFEGLDIDDLFFNKVKESAKILKENSNDWSKGFIFNSDFQFTHSFSNLIQCPYEQVNYIKWFMIFFDGAAQYTIHLKTDKRSIFMVSHKYFGITLSQISGIKQFLKVNPIFDVQKFARIKIKNKQKTCVLEDIFPKNHLQSICEANEEMEEEEIA